MDADAASASIDEKSRRIKSLLSSYYGADDEPDESQCDSQPSGSIAQDDSSSVASGFTPRIAGLDSAAFSADSYVSVLLRMGRIDTLLKRHSEMSREIKSLDSDMQMLVYENYNKFISATDTIRTMKTNVDGMGTNMEGLRNIIDQVGDTSNAVNSKLQNHRDHIEELNRVRILLQKLQSVIDLPKRLKLAVSKGAFEAAIDSYLEASPLLKKYGHQGALRAVATESDSALEEVVKKLQERLTDPEADSEECVRLLRRVGPNEEDLQEKFLVGRRRIVEAVLEDASKAVTCMASEVLGRKSEVELPESWAGEEGAPPTLSEFIKMLDERILNSLSETSLAFKSTFQKSQESADLDRTQLALMANAVMEKYVEVMGKGLAVEAAGSAIEVSQCASVESGSDFHGLDVQFADDWGTEGLSQGLVHIHADLILLDSRLPETQPRVKAGALVQSTVQHHISSCFMALTHRIVGIILAIKEELMKESSDGQPGDLPSGGPSTILQRGYSYICDVLQKALSSLLQSLKTYESNSRHLENWQTTFIDMIQTQLQITFLSLLSSLQNLAGVADTRSLSTEDHRQKGDFAPTGGDWKTDNLFDRLGLQLEGSLSNRPEQEETGEVDGESAQSRTQSTPSIPYGLVLLLARLCSFLETTVVPHAVEMLATIFPHGGGIKDRPAFNPSQVMRQLNAGASELLRLYVEKHGRQLTLMIRRSVAAASWLHHKEPRGPRAVCDLMLARLKIAEDEIVQLVDDGGHRSEGKSRTRSAAASSNPSMSSLEGWDLEGASLERNVAKLFREKIQICRRANFTQSSILAAIMGVGLKSLVECIRLETLGRAGLQQMQLDVFYLRPRVHIYARGPEGEMVDALMDEVITAAVERSVDPSLLEQGVIDRILSADST